jgi:hypothetical protein
MNFSFVENSSVTIPYSTNNSGQGIGWQSLEEKKLKSRVLLGLDKIHVANCTYSRVNERKVLKTDLSFKNAIMSLKKTTTFTITAAASMATTTTTKAASETMTTSEKSTTTTTTATAAAAETATAIFPFVTTTSETTTSATTAKATAAKVASSFLDDFSNETND